MGKLSNRLAKKLQELRGDTPQYLFARRLGISKSSLNRMELGDRNVSLSTLERLCARLKCDVSDLFPATEYQYQYQYQYQLGTLSLLQTIRSM